MSYDKGVLIISGMLRASNFSLLKSSLQECDKALSKFPINNIQARQDARADSSYSHTILFCYLLRHSALPHKLPDIIKTYQTSLSYLMKFTIKDIPADASAQPSPV